MPWYSYLVAKYCTGTLPSWYHMELSARAVTAGMSARRARKPPAPPDELAPALEAALLRHLEDAEAYIARSVAAML